MSKFQYSIRDYKHRFDLDTDGSFDANDGEILAEIAAEDFHNGHDGWEYQWPIPFRIFMEDVFIGEFSVDLEAEPVFHASASTGPSDPNG